MNKNSTIQDDLQLESINHAKFCLAYHVVIVTRQRKKILSADVADALKIKLPQLVSAAGCKTLALNVMQDHVHILITGTPKICLSDVLDYVKGNSSRFARAKFPALKEQAEHLWSKSYFVRSVSSTQGGIKKCCQYINNQ